MGERFVGHICRVLVLRLSVHAEMRERACSDECNFALRLAGPIDQKALRNLLIWQNHVLPSYLRPDDDRQADVALVLTSGSDNEPRLLDLRLRRAHARALSQSRVVLGRGDRRGGRISSHVGAGIGPLARRRTSERSWKNAARHHTAKSNFTAREAASSSSARAQICQ